MAHPKNQSSARDKEIRLDPIIIIDHNGSRQGRGIVPMWYLCHAAFLVLSLYSGGGCQEAFSLGNGISFQTVQSPQTLKERTIVAFGDSLTAGFGVPLHEAYPAVLERAIRQAGYSYRVLNAGVSGETTAGGLTRIHWILKNDPEIVILELGANDGLRGLDLNHTEQNLSELIALLRKNDAQVILAGMRIPVNYGRGYRNAFEGIFPALAERFKIPLIPFFLEGVATDPQLNQADGIHPTAEGYQRVVQQIWPILRPLLKK